MSVYMYMYTDIHVHVHIEYLLIISTSFSNFLILDSTPVSSIFHHGCALNPASLITDRCHSDGNIFRFTALVYKACAYTCN